MAERKRYEVRGMMEWHPEFRVGRGRLQVSFTGGHLCGGACTPASYETSDPVVQKVIESSSAFHQGRIRLVMEDGHWLRQSLSKSDRWPEGPVADTVCGLTDDSGRRSEPISATTPASAHRWAQTDCASGAAVEMNASPDRHFIFEYKDIDDVSDFLQFSKSVPLDRLHSEEDCFREAERLGIVLKKKDS